MIYFKLYFLVHIFSALFEIMIYNCFVKKIKKFNQEEVNIIKNVWNVNCTHLELYNAKHQCPICKKKFKRLPDVETFRKLILQFNATDTAWADVFKTDRSSVTKIRNKINPIKTNTIWDQNRFNDEKKYYNYLDKKPVEDYLSLLKKFPRSSEAQLLKIAEITKEYLELFLQNDFYLNSEYQNIKDYRTYGVSDYLYCVKCKIKKSINKFDTVGVDKTFAKLCTYCAELNLQQYNKLLDKNKSNE